MAVTALAGEPAPHAGSPSSETQSTADVTDASQILATAFGYQNDDSSTVLVKTFDLKTGALLSENSFDLPVAEETATGDGTGTARVLAGGTRIVSQGELKLALRVYDASSGRYLYEANFSVATEPESGALPTPVLGRRYNRASIRLTSGTERKPESEESPLFLVRALDPSNEEVVWQNQFASAEAAMGKVERMRYHILPFEKPIVKDQKYDFQVRMYNQRTGDLMWKDASALLVKPAGSGSREEDSLGKILPAWPSGEREDAAVEAIRYQGGEPAWSERRL
jgi:hypothetical protein